MKFRFKGNVVVREDQKKNPGGRGQRTIRAPEVEYGCVADRLIATDAKMGSGDTILFFPAGQTYFQLISTRRGLKSRGADAWLPPGTHSRDGVSASLSGSRERNAALF